MRQVRQGEGARVHGDDALDHATLEHPAEDGVHEQRQPANRRGEGRRRRFRSGQVVAQLGVAGDVFRD